MNTLNYIIVYSGPHYGRPHRLLTCEGTLWKALYDPTGEIVTFLRCDCEAVAGLGGDGARAMINGGAK